MTKKSFIEHEISVLQGRSALEYRHAHAEFESLRHDLTYLAKAANMAFETAKLSRFLLFLLIDKELE